MTKKDSAAYYNSLAEGYNDLHGEEQRAKYRILAHALALPINAQVLDVGAGTGVGNEFFPGALGIDPSSALIALHPNKDSIVGSAEALPFADNSFDTVLCVTAIHHTDVPRALKEMLRVSRKWVCVTVLKKSPQASSLRETIEKTLSPEFFFEEDKDWLFVADVEKIKNASAAVHS